MSGALSQQNLCLNGIKILTCKNLVFFICLYCNECESDWPFLGFRRILLLGSFEAFAALLLRSSFSVISCCANGWLVSDVAEPSLQPRNVGNLLRSDAPSLHSRRFTTLCFCSSVFLLIDIQILTFINVKMSLCWINNHVMKKWGRAISFMPRPPSLCLVCPNFCFEEELELSCELLRTVWHTENYPKGSIHSFIHSFIH